jgi:tungstate transport system ATP-binding protein
MRGRMNMRAPAVDLPITFDDVTVAAGAVTILDRITLTLSSGTPTVLIGPNGSGKTTLLRTAMGLSTPSRGRITWGGREQVPPMRRAILFQRPAMLRRSAGANIRFALRAAGIPRRDHNSRIGELLGLVGLEHLTDRPARRLSGGEQQRLALARALARDPAVLFLDEPTASLDPAATKAIEDIIHAVSHRGIKVVMATHDLGEARRLAGEIVMLHHGRLMETGAASSFFNTPQTGEASKFIAGDLLV